MHMPGGRISLRALLLCAACSSGGSHAPPEAGPPDSGMDAGITCTAVDAPSLLACVQQANAGALDRIYVTGPISCSGPKACAVVIFGRQRPLTLAGDSSTDAGLFRSGADDYALLVISNSSGISVRDLQFADPANISDYAHPTPYLTASNTVCPTDGGQCAPTLFVANSDHITFDGVTVLNSRWTAAQVGPASTLTVSRSRFLSFWLLGLQLIDVADASVQDNLFQDGRSNALIVSGTDIDIERNVFDHDHNAAAWWVAPLPPEIRQPSGGSMVFFYNHLHRVRFAHNEIRNGRYDDQIDPAVAFNSWGLRAEGIEIDYAPDLGQTTDFSQLTIADNDIHDLQGLGVSMPLEYAGDPAVAISIERNVFHNLVNDPFSGVPIQAMRRTVDAGAVYPFDAGNCYDPQCSAQPPVPPPPPAPTVTSFGTGCPDGYGIYLIGQFNESAYVHVRDAVTSDLLEVHMGPGTGPYQIRGRAYFPDAGGGLPSLAFCLVTPAARAAFADGGVRAFVVDPVTGENSGGVVLKHP